MNGVRADANGWMWKLYKVEEVSMKSSTKFLGLVALTLVHFASVEANACGGGGFCGPQPMPQQSSVGVRVAINVQVRSAPVQQNPCISGCGMPMQMNHGYQGGFQGGFQGGYQQGGYRHGGGQAQRCGHQRRQGRRCRKGKRGGCMRAKRGGSFAVSVGVRGPRGGFVGVSASGRRG